MTSKLLLPQQPVTAKGDAPSRDLVEIIQRIVADLDAAASGTSLAALDGRVTTLEGYARRVPLATKTASASATLDFTEFNNAVYLAYEFEFENVLPATDSTSFWMRFSTSGGSSYDAGASDYAYINYAASTGSSAFSFSNAATAAQVLLTFPNDVGNATGEEGVTGGAWLRRAGVGAVRTRVQFELSYENPTGQLVTANGKARRNTAQDTDAVRFLFSSGNIASGTIRMYGLT